MSVKDSFKQAASVTPDDDAENVYDALYIGSTGDVAVIPTAGAAAVTFASVPVGFFNVAVSKVMSTNTTASSILGLRFDAGS